VADRMVARPPGSTRLRGYLVGLGVVVLAALPAFSRADDDGYPFSTYPMFARPLSRATVYFVERVDGKRPRRLTPQQVSGNEVMQSFKSIGRAVHGGPQAIDAFCVSIAERVAKSERRRRRVTLEVVVARFDPVQYFTSGAPPEERTVVGRCKSRSR
jgi:hypothetical protein